MDADDWDRRYADGTRTFSSEPNPLLVELASPLVAGRALDLAAGAGRNALWLAQRGWRVTAVDFSRVGLERAAGRAAELGLELDRVHADLYDYRPPAAAFDLVLLAYMHPEAARRAAVLAAAAEAVAPAGHLLVVGFDVTDPHEGGGPADPERRFSVARLSGAFPGIELERCER
ncbi:MAG: methyltransferase domain-containing protein, partial [Actinomycetota bacterium]|nr:methyltransferase domain-containing protein [Actinomycetota bacterium]